MLEHSSQSNKTSIDDSVFAGTIDKIHQEIHEGQVTTINYLALAVANDGYARLRITTGEKRFHVALYFDVEAKAYLKTYAGTTYTAEGTLPDTNLTVFNRNSGNAKAFLFTVRYNPTVNVLGTQRGNRLLPGGTGGNSVGLSGGERIESVIPPNSDFLIEVQNKGGQTKDIGIIVEGYEE